MHDPLMRVARQIDFLVPREILESALDIGLLQEAERKLDANDGLRGPPRGRTW